MATVAEIMTPYPYAVSPDASLTEVALIMRDGEVGDVLIVDDEGHVDGIVTDRDIAVRLVADGRDPAVTTARDICTSSPVTISPDDDVSTAARFMRELAVRRLPVSQDGRLVGIVSLGDLALNEDPRSALAEISEQPANN
jgi:CBS domain-containing protein